jgi:hypothetical protein
MGETRINLANLQELLELPGVHQAAGDAIVRHRGQHGPIMDAIELTQILDPRSSRRRCWRTSISSPRKRPRPKRRARNRATCRSE